MTHEELAKFDGLEGRKAYVAVSGNIYDFTESGLWQNGDHQGMHRSGCDLTEELKAAPHVRAVIERFPVVDQLKEDVPGQKPPSGSKTVGIIIGIIIIVFVAFFLLR